jgi:hypothetical protein
MSEHREAPPDAQPIRGSVGLRLPDEATGRPLSRRAQAALPLATVGAGMLVRRVIVRPPDVVFVKGVVEASDGLAAVFAEQGGELVVASPPEREAELWELLADLEAELGAEVTSPSTCPPPGPPVTMGGDPPCPPARPVTALGERGQEP